jgi:hypothetical protein
MIIDESAIARLQAENTNLRCFLWLLVSAAGGNALITKSALEMFNPQTARLEFKKWLDSGDYFIEATNEDRTVETNDQSPNRAGEAGGPVPRAK